MKRLVLTAVLVLVGCGEASTVDTVNKFFAGQQIGNSSDFAIMQDSHHVITMHVGGCTHPHGRHRYDDDLSMCLTIVEKLKADSPLADFSCVPFNH